MNVLFLEDEVELNDVGVEQLRNLGHTVHPALNLAEARTIVDEHWQNLHLIMADHRLPDGHGIDYLLEVKERYPRIKLAVVSGCLTPDDEHTLKVAEIPFFTKPLLYRQVMQKLREHYMIQTRPPIPPRPLSNTKPPLEGLLNQSTAERPKSAPPAPVLAGVAEGEQCSPQQGAPAPKRKGLTSMIFGKLTRKD